MEDSRDRRKSFLFICRGLQSAVHILTHRHFCSLCLVLQAILQLDVTSPFRFFAFAFKPPIWSLDHGSRLHDRLMMVYKKRKLIVDESHSTRKQGSG